jgi:hypothetical protein
MSFMPRAGKLARVDVLNYEMKAAGVRIFVGGLHPARSVKLREESRTERLPA